MIHIRTTALLLTLALGPVAQQTGREVLPRPDPAVQGGIRRLLDAKDEGEQRAALGLLESKAGNEHELLVPQLFLFSAQATDTRDAMAFGVVLRELDIPADHVVRALVPLLESDDPDVREELGNVLSEYEHLSVDRGADFSLYRPLLERDPSPGLVRHLYEVDPESALLVLSRAQVTEPFALRSLLWAQHEASDVLWKLRHGFVSREEVARAEPEALAELDFLAQHPQWWARLFAARIGALEPALAVRRDELSRDPNPLVREAAGAPEPRGR